MSPDSTNESAEDPKELAVSEPATELATHEEEQAEKVVAASADVLRVSGISVALSPHVYLLLTFLDAVINKHPWQPDERILLALLVAYGLLGTYYWKSRGQ